MDSALEAIQFFANSANSVSVFEALSDDVTTSRALEERTEASRSTVARILDEGESRGWIASEGSRYELTAVGEIMLSEFRTYLQTVEGIQHLGDAVNWLPAPARTLDYRDLRDADIVTGVADNPTKPFDYVADAIRDATEIRTLASTGIPRLTKLINGQSAAGELNPEAVMKRGFFDTLTGKPEQLSNWREPAERGEVWAYDGSIPISLHIVDRSVAIWLAERQGEELTVQGLLVTEEPNVLSWAESRYEQYRAESELLDPEELSED